MQKTQHNTINYVRVDVHKQHAKRALQPLQNSTAPLNSKEDLYEVKKNSNKKQE
jgi:hypothetical protein